MLIALLRKLTTHSVSDTLKLFERSIVRLETRIKANNCLVREKDARISQLTYECNLHERENKTARNAIAELKKITEGESCC